MGTPYMQWRSRRYELGWRGAGWRICVNRYEIYAPSSGLSMYRRWLLEKEVANALLGEGLYCGLLSLIDQINSLICEIELLRRWHHCDLGEICSSEFVGLAERAGLIFEKGSRIIARGVGPGMRVA